MKAATERFSDRVENYVRFRPGYPAQVLDLLEGEAGLRRGARVADLGAGTGIFSALLLARGAEVFAVEPNAAMRAAAKRRLGGEAGFHSLAAPAEATGLPTASMDLTVAAQAFHWFDRRRAREEIHRILRPGGSLALIWNERRIDTSEFLRGYEQMLRDYAPEYGVIDHRDITAEEVAAFFRPGRVALRRFSYRQQFDYPGLKGRLLSSSYAPAEGQPDHRPMLQTLRRLFERHRRDGRVEVEYETRVFYGTLG